MIELHNPHATLGAHRQDGGVVIRAFRPEAAKVVVKLDGSKTVEMTATDEPGLFEAVVKGADLPLSYELEVAYPDGNVFTVRDPYAFPPTIGDLDLHLAGEGRHERLYEKLGAHVKEVDRVTGTAFAVWAPNAASVGVVGDFNSWDGRLNPMRSLGASGIWELFVPDVGPGEHYKYELRTATGELRLKADPFAFHAEHPPQTSSIVHVPRYEWRDEDWLEQRAATRLLQQPVSIYEVHLGSWRRDPAKPGFVLSYREAAEELGDYAVDMGFTHVELLPIMQHPFSGSWGYQVTGYYAPHSWFGEPDDFRFLVDELHRRGIGVILDWVPAHFPRDDWALARFDGTSLYEHDDPRRGAHPDWGTLVFNLGRNEVRNFLLSNALFWLREFHVDGLRVDAVASMLYLDYSRKAGEWVPNEYGGNEDLDTISFLKEVNEVAHAGVPGVLMCAEESTSWPGVSRPTYVGGLGFGFKWNMGWMHDTLDYFQNDPVYRQYHHHQLTFSLMYAFSENFILPLSHDEVVHGKGSLVSKMPGDRWQKLANLRSLYAYMWAHPGKKLLFMGGELAPNEEWSEARSLDWWLLEHADHAGVQSLVRELNRVYRAEPALWELDHTPEGFQWLELNDAGTNVLAFARFSQDRERSLVCVCNFAPIPREAYRIGMPQPGRWREVLNTDSAYYGGTDWGNLGGVEAEGVPWHDQPFSAEVTLPPLGVVWLVPEPSA